MSAPAADEPLVCSGCAREEAGHGERFCSACGMPLVFAGADEVDVPVDEPHERARKIKKQYLDGPLVRVASARHQAEAELMQNLLLEVGVPSLVRRSGGFDVPDMMFAGPRDILVPRAGAEVARDMLAWQVDVPPRVATTKRSTRTVALVLAVCLFVAGVGPAAALFWVELRGG